MNRYGLMAKAHWARWLPARYAAIEDPGSFFSALGNQAGQRIDQLAAELAGDDQPGEGYLGKAGRLGRARRQAEEVVLAELILLPPEPGASEDQPPQPPPQPSPQGRPVTVRRGDPLWEQVDEDQQRRVHGD